jgi:hypothetical protein
MEIGWCDAIFKVDFVVIEKEYIHQYCKSGVDKFLGSFDLSG